MSTLGKIQASLASATQETTVALANLKFDFSLVKVEAPPEYRELGLALPRKKRSDGEDGPIHVTAQRLGSLFHSMLPETPNLIRVYGQRASEIARSAATSSHDGDAYGPFHKYLGIDGTSIWAAATSSSAAIACHLLACLLACCWRPDEATAIWLEIVSERKSQLEVKMAQAEWFELKDAVSSKISLDKDQLAGWDNSARAWLAAANESPVVKRRQKAVRCLLDRVNGTVHSHGDLFTSVTTAWKLALETLEKIIGGMSCHVTDGAVVVALLSWHIFPDIIMLSPVTEEIKQRDDLIETAGQVTIGLKPSDHSALVENGVHWSLSLGHLRYYQVSQVTSKALRCTPSGGDRFTFGEFILVYLGSWFRQWSFREEITLEQGVEFTCAVTTKICETVARSSEDVPRTRTRPIDTRWCFMLKAAVAVYKNGTQADRDRFMKLLAIGWRHPGLAELPCGGRYRSLGFASPALSYILSDEKGREWYERESIKDYLSTEQSSIRKPHFLVFIAFTPGVADECTVLSPYLKPSHLRKGQCSEAVGHLAGGFVVKSQILDEFTVRDYPIRTNWQNPPRGITRLIKHRYYSASREITLSEVWRTSTHVVLACTEETIRYEFGVPFRQVQDLYLSTRDILRLDKINEQSPSAYTGFTFLSCCQDIYADLPGATISPHVIYSPFHITKIYPQTNGVPALYNLRTPSSFGFKALAFKAIAFLETGEAIGMNLEDSDWESIVALSTENTLYMYAGILSNPSGDGGKIRRVQGNVGLPGLTIIGTPSVNNTKGPDADKWSIINHHHFDGTLSDEFSRTTLHLQLTGYSYPLQEMRSYASRSGLHSIVPKGAYVEAVVSAFDSGEWIGDLDTLSHFRFLDTPPEILYPIHIVRTMPGCRGNAAGLVPDRPLVAIENWEEFFNPHPGLPGVVKCHGNWQARLAVICLCRQLGYLAVVFDSHGCWDCAFKAMDGMLRRSVHVPSSRDSSTVPSDSPSSSEEDGEDEDRDEEDVDENEDTSRQGPSRLSKIYQQNFIDENSAEANIGDDKRSTDNTFSVGSGYAIGSRDLPPGQRPVFFIL